MEIIVLDGPDVTGIQEQAQLNNPEELGPVLQIDVEAYVTALENEVLEAVVAVEAARSQGAHTPTAHAVSATAVEALLKRQLVAVAIGDGDACTHVESDALAAVEVMGKGIVGFGLDILRVTDTQCLVGPVLISLLTSEARQSVEQVAGGLDRGANGEHVTLEQTHLLHIHHGLVGAVEVVAHPHDQVVLVAVGQ